MSLGLKPIEIVNSGKHPLLIIHKTWSRILFKDIAVVQNGYAIKSSLFSKTGGIPLIHIRDIGKDKMEELYKSKYSDECIVRKGDILIGMDGDFNCREWNGSDSLLNQRVGKVF